MKVSRVKVKVTMKQQSGTIALHQVVQITEDPKEKARIKNNCYVKAATVLGVIQIICGFIALGDNKIATTL